jgi:N-acetylated-alpha-linked acidic dipeptidase
VKDPRTGKSTFEIWLDLQNKYRQTPSVDGWGDLFDPDQELTEPWIFTTPYDDAAPFFNLLALPASDMYYGADYGMYHSIYENFHWMKTVVDPTFEYHIVMSQMQGLVSLRLANADLLPLDYAGEANFWRLTYLELDRMAKAKGTALPMLQQALNLINEWQKEAEGLESDRIRILKDAPNTLTQKELQEVNQAIYLAARNFFRKEGLPGLELDRNLWAGSAGTLTGIRYSLDKEGQKFADAEAKIYIEALQQRIKCLKAIRSQLRAIHQS